MNARATILLGLALAICPVGAIGEAAKASPPSPPSLSGLLSEDEHTRHYAILDLLDARSNYIKNVIALAEREDLDKTERGPVYLAVVLLGKLRATEAVPCLSERISYLPPLYGGVFRSDSAGAMETYYPCAVALTEIGEPCLGAMDHLIWSGETKLERNLAAWVMMQVQGKDVALYKLNALTKKPYEKNYEEAKDFILDYKPVLRHPLIPASRWEKMENPKPVNPHSRMLRKRISELISIVFGKTIATCEDKKTRSICELSLIIALLTVPCCARTDEARTDKLEWPTGIESAIQIKDDLREGQLEQARKNLADLASTDRWVREFAEQRMVGVRAEVIKGLVGTVEDKASDQSFNGALYRAITLLGAYRAAEGTSALASRLTYLPVKGDFVPPIEGEYEAYYPSAKALVSIGQPAVDAMVQKVGGWEMGQERALAAWVVVKIAGKEQATSRFERLARDTKDARQRANFLWAKEYAASYAPKKGNPFMWIAGEEPKT